MTYAGIMNTAKPRLAVFDMILCFLFSAAEKLKPKAEQTSGGKVSAAEINANAERMLDQYGNAVLRMAYSYLHNMSDAEEILQETLIRYLQTAPQLSGDAHEKAWLLRVAANLSKNRIKYNTVRQTDELNEELIAEDREDLSFVWEAVSSLPEKYRETVHLFYHEGFSTKQISDILGRKESTVRSDLNRARKQLKEILKEAYDFEG